MFSRSVFLLVLTASAGFGVSPTLTGSVLQAQAAPAQDASAQSSSSQTPAQTAPLTPSQNVQARIRARREQRRATAIHDVYSHLYEVYVGTGFTRTIPGPGAIAGKGLQHYNLYNWNVGVSRYYSERLGITVDARGSYGTAYIGNNAYDQNHPAISQYSGMIGPTYRFYMQPKYSVSARVLGGASYGNFAGDTNKIGSELLGLYPDGVGAAVSASVPVEYNMAPGLGLRLAPEYYLTSFGSTIQNGWGMTGGIVVRWGKQ